MNKHKQVREPIDSLVSTFVGNLHNKFPANFRGRFRIKARIRVGYKVKKKTRAIDVMVTEGELDDRA